MKEIIIVKGDTTGFAGRVFATINIISSIWDLSTLTAKWTLHGITTTKTDLTTPLEINYSKTQTDAFPLGTTFGELVIENAGGERLTVVNTIPVKVIQYVDANAIATGAETWNIEVKDGDQLAMEIQVEAGVSVEVGETTTLPEGSDARVENSGTPNHLILHFFIPRGNTGNGIQKIEKTSTSGLVDTYTITYTDDNTETFNVTNGKDATINGHNAIELVGGPGASVTQSGTTTTIGADVQSVNGKTGVVVLNPSDVGALPSTTKYGASLVLSLNQSNYQVTATLKDQDGNTLGTSQVIDLPLESVVVSGSYDSVNKQIVLVLQNGNKINIPVGDLVSGLQTTITGAATTITDNNLTANRALIANGSGKVAVSPTTSTELGCLSGVTSSVQTQLNGKQPVGSYATTTELSDSLAKKIDKGYAVNDFASNCLTEIPQNINLVLSSGTLTIKAGSIITYPDGTQLSNAQDRSVTHSGTGQLAIFVNQSANAIILNTLEKCYSGANPPSGMVSGSYYIWYDTTNGLVKRTNDAGSTWTSGFSLPIGIVTVSGGAISSIDQVFNGIGYIGHHAFVLPGVSCLTPNGFNTDGTLNSKVAKNSVLRIIELTSVAPSGYERTLWMQPNGAVGQNSYREVNSISDLDGTSNYTYVRDSNIYCNTVSGNINLVDRCVIAEFALSNNTVIKFKVRPVSGLSASYINTALGLTASKAVVTDASGNVGTSPTTSTEIGYLAGVTSSVQTQLNEKAVASDVSTALSTKIDKGYAVNDFATNCLKGVSQDIKLEIVGNNLVARAGTKYYDPQGNEYQTASDKTWYPSANGKRMIAFRLDTGALANIGQLSEICSGSTDSLAGVAYHSWYDTTNGVINRYDSDGTTLLYTASFPVAIVTVTNNNRVSSIDQVFNGLGFIGLKVFALPGLRGLISNGRNPDGTLKALDVTVNSVSVSGNDGTDRTGVYLQSTGQVNRVAPSSYSFSVEENIYKLASDGTQRYILKVADVTFTDGVITSMNVIPVSALASDYVNKALGYTPQAVPTITSLSSSNIITIADNTIYNDGGAGVSNISITNPSTYDVSFVCTLNFTSGNTPTTINVANTMYFRGDDCDNSYVFTPVMNKRYTVIIYYDGVAFWGIVKGN